MDQEMKFELEETLSTDQPPERFVDKINWFFRGFAYPIWSRTFYKKAAGKRLGAALIFLIGFALLQTLVSTVTVAINLSSVGREIDTAYQTGEIPDIRIENGLASVSGTGKYTIESNRQFFGIDTTGSIQEIDTNRYSEGLLLTSRELHLVNGDGYQVLPLSDLNATFGNPIVLDASTMSSLWSGLAILINIFVLFGGFLFYSLGRFIYLALLGLIVWGAASLGSRKVDFAPILITGIYANVPTTYFMFILRKIGLAFLGLRAIILLTIWGLAIAYVLKDQPGDIKQGELPGDFV